MFRVGEANTPGPCGIGYEKLAFDHILWNFNVPDGNNTLIGVCNPSGIANKHDTFSSLPSGWWGCAETQASSSQLASFRKAVKRKGDSFNSFRVVSGAAAPHRTGSQSCGSWTGVLQLSSTPLRQVHLPVDEDITSSGRIVSSVGVVHQQRISHSTVYLPPKGPTYPNSKALSERLLEPLTQEIVLGRRGHRLISGDFNTLAGSLENTKIWIDQGWREIQQLFFERYGIEPQPTCRGATAPDQLWLSPELQAYVTDVGFLDLFPDHRVLIGCFSFPPELELQHHWPMPGRIPWETVDKDIFEENLASLPNLSHQSDSTGALKTWCRSLEKVVSESHLPDPLPGGTFGRCATLGPSDRPLQAGVPKASRPGEAVILSSFLGRSVQLWFQQRRRFQHLVQALRNPKSSSTKWVQCQALWTAILRARGFRGSFRQWWPHRPRQKQGTLEQLPLHLPDLLSVEQIASDFWSNYQAYEQWHHRRRAASLEAKWQEAHDRVFSTVKNEPKDHIDTLVDETTQQISLVDAQASLVSVDEPFPDGAQLGWKLNGVPAQVRRLGDYYVVHSDLLLCDGQALTCEQLVHSPDEIHRRLEELWSRRWNKHAGTSTEQWQRAFNFACHNLPRGQMEWKPLTYDMWVTGLKRFKARAARGPDGWSREDLLNLPRTVVDQFLNFFSAIENGHAWPQQWSVALVHCIEKTVAAKEVNSYRPITLFSMFYRLWAGIRASQILRFLASFADEGQCGFLPECQASDLWWYIQMSIEYSSLANEAVHGVVADLVKAYNLLPRLPVWQVLYHLGIPKHFLDCWSRFLGQARRHFVVRGSCSPGLVSTTGYPEGCPLSCCAMVAVDVLWHRYQACYATSCRSLSYVDNLELMGEEPGQVIRGLQVTFSFCDMLDLEIDVAKLYGWSSTPQGRKSLKEHGIQIFHHARDLGGQMNYTHKKHVQVQLGRLKVIATHLDKLKNSRLSPAQKRLCVAGAILPRGLHAAENILIADNHLDRLRTQIHKALRWDRAGASPLVRIGLLHPKQLDPGLFQLLRSLLMFRRQCMQHPFLQERWRSYCDSFQGSFSFGPLGKLSHELARLGWHVSADLQLTTHEGLRFSFLTMPSTLLQRLALEAWQMHISQRVCERQGLHDLHGLNAELLAEVDAALLPAQVESLAVIRDGSFFTNDYISKFDDSKLSCCSLCGVTDTRDHRYAFCGKYSRVHESFGDLLAVWEQLPASLRLHGLPSTLPTQTPLRRALEALHDAEPVWHFRCPPSGALSLFTDGSCSNPQNSALAIASWSIVCPDYEGCVAAGCLPGVQQTIPRAETWALLMCLRWSVQFQGTLHLWIDSQLTVEGFRLLQSNGYYDTDSELADLWELVHQVYLIHQADVRVHKVAAHLDPHLTTSPLEDWCLQWNSAADQAARIANQTRPLSLAKAHDAHSTAWQRQRHLLQRIVSLHLAIADFDFAASDGSADPIEQADVQYLPQVLSHDFWYYAQAESCSLTWLQAASSTYQLPVAALTRLDEWLVCTEERAEFVGAISLLEIYIAFCLEIGKPCIELLGHKRNPFLQLTLATDFSWFRKCFFSIIRAMESPPGYIRVSLANLGIHSGLTGIPFGWRHDLGQLVHEKLREFVGCRPVLNHQGYARPWRLV